MMESQFESLPSTRDNISGLSWFIPTDEVVIVSIKFEVAI